MAIRKRCVVPDVFSDPDLCPVEKRYLFENLQTLAEDSGCLPWSARFIRGELFRFDTVTATCIQKYMAELVGEGRVWPYESNGKPYAHLPDFRTWQHSLSRWNEPVSVPLPPGIVFIPSDATNQKGSGATYGRAR